MNNQTKTKLTGFLVALAVFGILCLIVISNTKNEELVVFKDTIAKVLHL